MTSSWWHRFGARRGHSHSNSITADIAEIIIIIMMVVEMHAAGSNSSSSGYHESMPGIDSEPVGAHQQQQHQSYDDGDSHSNNNNRNYF